MRAAGEKQYNCPQLSSIVRLAACALLAVLLPSCATVVPTAAELAPGRIWDVRETRFVDERELVGALSAARFRLLGERHDNAGHHAVRARLIAAMAAGGARPAVVFEQFTLDHDAALRAAQVPGIDAERLADAGRLERRSWDWPLHKPVVEAALAIPLPIRAGNLARNDLRGDVQQAVERSDAGWAARLRAAPWSATQRRALEEDIVDGHCGKLPPSVVPRIVLAQRARDAALAQALVDAATPSGAILIAGNGHVRRDVGVPAYLAPTERVLSVGFVEVPNEPRDAAEFARTFAERHAAFDYVWLTGTVVRDDPCKAMPAPKDAPPAR
jgi:uncharacterized iron-regulated protein